MHKKKIPAATTLKEISSYFWTHQAIWDHGNDGGWKYTENERIAILFYILIECIEIWKINLHAK